MTALTIVIGVCLVVLALAGLRSWMRGERDPELGSVSEQWIAEQRLGPDRFQ